MNLLQQTVFYKTRSKILAILASLLIRAALYVAEKIFKKVNLGILDYQQATQILNLYSTKPQNNAISKDPAVDESIELSIIVPVYNGEKFIRECVESIVNQKTKYMIQIIIVNDGSTDATETILQQYVSDDRVKLISQSNKGFSGARNTGIDHAQGRYIMFVDSDDYLFPNAVDSLLNTVISLEADIIQGEYSNISMDGKFITKTMLNGNKKIPQRCDTYSLPGYPWAKIYRRNLFNGIRFPENFWFEDSIINNIIYPLANYIYTVDTMVYAYRINTNGITQTFKGKSKCVDSVWILEELYKYAREANVKIDSHWIDNLCDQIIVRCYERLHDLPLRLQKASYSIICDVFQKFVKLSPEKINTRNRRVNAILSKNFYLWKIICLQNRWGIK